MTQPPPGAIGVEGDERVVALLGSPADAELCARALSLVGVDWDVYTDPEAFADGVKAVPDVVIMAERYLDGPAGDILTALLTGQPEWSSLPLILLCHALPPGGTRQATHRFGELGRLMLLEGPVRTASFVSTVETALRERRQQYRIRDLLAERARQIRQRDEFLALLGHELRNPLAAISICAEVLRQVPPDGDQAGECLAVVQNQSGHMKRMLDDLLDVSRLTRGKLTLQRSPLDLGEVLRSCLAQVRGELDGQAQNLVVELPGAALPVLGDATRLQQVFSNLLQNASRYTDRGERIELSAARVDGLIRVRVADPGQGMTAETLAHLFQPFYQAEGATRRVGQKGLGLGLALAAHLVELHGGAIRAHSDGPGRGSTFVVTLPLARVTGTGETASREPEAASRVPPRRLLLIEDNGQLAGGLKALLENRGHQVRLAHDGLTGVEVAREWRPDVAVVDIGLPGIDGYEVAARLRRLRLDGMRLVALTGYGSEDDRRRAREAGFARHLTKPASIDELEAAIGAGSSRSDQPAGRNPTS